MITNLVLIVIAAICLVAGVSVSARVCVLTTEPDESAGGRVRFVLPPGDPCSCTHVVLGGHNAYAPPRQDQPVYIDTLPMDVKGLRKLQGCPNESLPSEDPLKTSTLPDKTSETPVTSRELQVEYTNSQDALDQGKNSSGDESTQSGYPKLTSTPLDEPSETPVASEVQVVYTDCQDARNQGKNASGVYTINKMERTFKVYCDMETYGKGYIVIQRRRDGSVDFNRNWTDYEGGFGDLNGEFWLGNDKIHSLTFNNIDWELLVSLAAFDGSVGWVQYKKFILKELKDDYEIDVSFDGGDAGDSLDSKRFTTFDEDNDDDGNNNCAETMGGGWWFVQCNYKDTKSNLNGVYSNTASVEMNQGIYWSTWKSDQSLKATDMKIRTLT